MSAKFIQIHTLTGYAATLLNRDDIGRAKRLPFGGSERIRVSSQCLKRHWREATGKWSIKDIGTGKSTRSRRIFSDVIAPRLHSHGMSNEDVLHVLVPLRSVVLGDKKIKDYKKGKPTPKKDDSENGSTDPLDLLRTEQVIVLGDPEINFLTELALELSRENAETTAKAISDYFQDKNQRNNLKSLAQGSGLDAALFGRMVTSDMMARTDAAVHVAHSFTVHAEDSEQDYFSALDDIIVKAGELGSGHINTSELTSGFFYSYVVIDLDKLDENLSKDQELAAEVVRRLIHLIATVSPGAKLGSTAPYACAEFVLAEFGSRQPRTLANAFMKPIRNSSEVSVKDLAAQAISDYLNRYDRMYGPHEDRRVASMLETDACKELGMMSIDELSHWAAKQCSV